VDPQRQYAQLLTLWAKGSKTFRRFDQHPEGFQSEWDLWWRLGRRLVERQFHVLPIPGLPKPVLVVAWSNYQIFLADRDLKEWRAELPEAWWGDRRPTPVWRVNAHDATFSLTFLMRWGQRGFTAWERVRPSALAASGEDETIVADSIDDGLTILGALIRYPRVFSHLPPSAWAWAGRLVRHPGTWQQVPQVPDGLATISGMAYDPRTDRWCWLGQDEDSVHKR